ncbi:thiopeptide-type bacteriocin biosynthesis protein [Streptomyces sp. NPDC013455]|uniref:thiopeptide-type bacteriocin biosynthesis protein n=1 Tax=Streptomyces sp. NPDC013455 TaxID=3155605 RepID=UPI0033F25783
MLDVEQLLADCLRDARDTPFGTVPVDSRSPSYASARRTFVTAGLSALRDDLPEAGWVQIGLAPGPPPWTRTYQVLADTARELIARGRARSFFFMHKPPGLRVRFEVSAPGDGDALREELLGRFGHLDGRPGPPLCGVYEPETYLFGGARSMRYVHELFTMDSLAWLDHHVGHGEGGGSARPVADWRVSLALLSDLLRGLGVVGWEHRGVWQVVRDEAGRRLAGPAPDDDTRRAAAGIAEAWHAGRDGLLAPVPPERRAVLEAHGDAVFRAAERWRTGYFESGQARVGPRRAAAHHAVFHWNRGRLSLARQSLLVHALAGDGTPR